MSRIRPIPVLPKLNDRDEQQLSRILSVAVPQWQHQRNQSHEIFVSLVGTFQDFIIQNNDDYWKRALTVGLALIDNCLAVNTSQISLILDASKSCINKHLKEMGWRKVDHETSVELLPCVQTYLKLSKAGSWTIRKRRPTVLTAPTPYPSVPYALSMDFPLPSLPKPESDPMTEFLDDASSYLDSDLLFDL
jgi:hypothetical protein